MKVYEEETAIKILGLIKTKRYNRVSYCGCWSGDTVSFEVARIQNDSIEAGFVLTVPNDIDNLKILSIRRLTGLQVRNIYGGERNSGYKKVYDRYNLPLV
jgi:hypothetical protein